MNSRIIIGIAGKKRSGKDTTADIIKCYSGNKVKTFAFATILKEVIQKVFLISDEEMNNQKEVKINQQMSPQISPKKI